MMLCKHCTIPMLNVMSFSKDKHEKFTKCPKCHSETKHRIINDNYIFDEIFQKELHK